MAYMILSIIYGFYLGGASLIIWHGISHLLFSKNSAADRAKYFVRCLFVAVLWPFLALSRSGRAFFSKFSTKI